MKRHLVWLRADLRTIDNTALAEACADRDAEVACVYAITPQQWQLHDVAGVRIDFELRTLAVLQRDLAALNIPLLLIEVPDFSALPQALVQLAQQHDVITVYANRQYEINEMARDRAVAMHLSDAGIGLHLFHDQCVLPPGSVKKNDGGPYSVFTPFKRNWRDRINTGGISLQPSPRRRTAAFSASPPFPRK